MEYYQAVCVSVFFVFLQGELSRRPTSCEPQNTLKHWSDSFISRMQYSKFLVNNIPEDKAASLSRTTQRLCTYQTSVWHMQTFLC